MLKSFMLRAFSHKSLQVTVCFVGLFLVLIVNREFGVADNGDFSRYLAHFSSKPLDLKENWPLAGSNAWTKRFFHEPIFYWSPPFHNFPAPWFSSTASIWTVGKAINDFFFSPHILNLKYIGLPFFILQGIALCYLLIRIGFKPISNVVACVGIFFIFTDARISAFYNSFYSESLPILALFSMSAYFFEITFSSISTRQRNIPRIFFGFAALILCISAIFAKRQYLYFLLPTLCFGFFIIRKELAINRSLKNYIFLFFSVIVVFAAIFLFYVGRLDSPGEIIAIRNTSYNSIYSGLLIHANDPAKIIEQLGLPQESKSLIGKNAFMKDVPAFIDKHPSFGLTMLLKAISIEPSAFLKSILSNLNEVGNFNIPLGMIYGSPDKYPPKLISVASLISTQIVMEIPPAYFYGFFFLLVLIIFISNLALHMREHNASRFFMAILFFIFIADVAVSAFDGEQEARKHVLIASTVGLLIVNYFLACVVSIFFTNVKQFSEYDNNQLPPA